MVFGITYLIYLNCLTLYFVTILKAEKMQKVLRCQFLFLPYGSMGQKKKKNSECFKLNGKKISLSFIENVTQT